MKNIDSLLWANGWLVEFIKRNGITEVPEWWAYLLNTFGILSYISLFCIFLAVMMGYSRQMSTFYFFYERVVGERLKNPYKPAVFFCFLWLALSMTSFFISLTSICVLKYSLWMGVLCGVVGFGLLISLFFLSSKVCDDKRGPDVVVDSAYPVYQQISPAAGMQNAPLPSQGNDQQFIAAQAGSGVPPQPLLLQDEVRKAAKELTEALMLFGLMPDSTRELLEEKFLEKLSKVDGDAGLTAHVRSRYEFLVSNHFT